MTLPMPLRVIAYLEGTTLIALMGIAVPLKRLAGMPEAVSIMGPIHGVCFLLYLWAVFDTVGRGKAPSGFVWKAILAAVIPGGTYWYLWRLGRR